MAVIYASGFLASGTNSMTCTVAGAAATITAGSYLAGDETATLLMPSAGYTAFTAIVACINNVGPGLGEVAPNFQSVNASGLWISTIAMLLGRLEIFPILVLLSPGFWRG